MKVAIVENTRVTHHGQVGVALHQAAAIIDLYKPWSGQPLPDTVDADALVVFGGEQTALDDHTHPYLPGLARLMASYTAMDRPVLGICLGGQLLARAFGGQNILDATAEFGWCDVTKTAAATADPVLAALPATFPVYQWHTDTFTLPETATLLATAARATNQCFRINRATYGMQFHFEVSRAVATDWNRRFPEAVERMHPGWLAQFPTQAETLGVQADAHGLAIAQAWINLI